MIFLSLVLRSILSKLSVPFKFSCLKMSEISASEGSIFTSHINPMDGTSYFVKQPEFYDYYQEIARSSYGDMLHDTERNKKYDLAIQKAIRTMKAQGRLAKVLDIGTGTGLLSMMAARAGADNILACEVFRPVAECAKDVIQDNGLKDKIKIIRKHSTKLTIGLDGDIKEKANILVAEVFDTELIGEGALRTFQHALENLLEPDSIVVPSSAQVFAQVIHSPLVFRWNKVFPISVNSKKSIIVPAEIEDCPGTPAVHDVQMSQLKPDLFSFVTDPMSIFDFDFCGRKEIKMNEKSSHSLTAICDGDCQAVFMWWVLKMDMDGEILLNNGPKWVQPVPVNCQWRDHWMQAIYYLPQSIRVSKGQQITLDSHHDEYSMWFSAHKSLIESQDQDVRPVCSCAMHVANSRQRIGMKNDQRRNDKFIMKLLQVSSPTSRCLCIGEDSLLPLIAAKIGFKKVFCTEPNVMHANILKSYIKTNELTNDIKIITKEIKDVVINDLEMETIDILLAEPYFLVCVQPFELLRFWHLRHVLNPVLTEGATVFPSCGRLMAVVIEFEDLWKIRAPVKNAEGFNLSKFDRMVQRAISMADPVVEPQPLWEYPCKALSEPFTLLEFDFSKDTFRKEFEIQETISIASEGVCNGLAIWTEYNLKDIEVSTGPTEQIKPGARIDWSMNHSQGVHFVRDCIKVSPSKHAVKCSLKFDMQKEPVNFVFKSEVLHC